MRCRIRVDPSRLIVTRMKSRLRTLSRRTLGICIVGLGIWTRALNVGVDRCKRHLRETVEGRFTLNVLALTPLVPALQPCIEVLARVEVDIQVVVHRLQPFVFHAVQLGNRDTTDF